VAHSLGPAAGSVYAFMLPTGQCGEVNHSLSLPATSLVAAMLPSMYLLLQLVCAVSCALAGVFQLQAALGAALPAGSNAVSLHAVFVVFLVWICSFAAAVCAAMYAA
jgi:hypothetical protein